MSRPPRRPVDLANLDPEQRRAARSLERIERFGKLLDASFRIPGTDFHAGIDPLIGLIPGIGDVVGAMLSGYLVLEAWRARVGRRALGKMVRNVGLEFVVGLVPVLGDVFDFGFKANLRNAKLAEDAIRERYFPVEAEPEETPLWRQPRALLIVSAASVGFIFLMGVAFGRCSAG